MALGAPIPGVPVVVTGASAGIGEALAAELAARGHDLMLVARRRDRLRTLAQRLRERDRVKIEVRPGDLADAEQRHALAAELAGRDIAGLCNNAGVGAFGRYLDADREQLANMVELNTAAVDDLMAAVLPGMVARGEGAVLNVASILGHGPQPHMAVYAATKAFTLALGEAVHAELAGTGVSVTSLSPGPVRTEIYGSSDADDLVDLGPDALWQEPAELARAAIDAMEDGERSTVPGLLNWLAAAGGRYLPRTIRLPLQNVLGAALPELRHRVGI